MCPCLTRECILTMSGTPVLSIKACISKVDMFMLQLCTLLWAQSKLVSGMREPINPFSSRRIAAWCWSLPIFLHRVCNGFNLYFSLCNRFMAARCFFRVEMFTSRQLILHIPEGCNSSKHLECFTIQNYKMSRSATLHASRKGTRVNRNRLAVSVRHRGIRRHPHASHDLQVFSVSPFWKWTFVCRRRGFEQLQS